MSLVVHACCGKDTSNLVGCASGTSAMSPTLRQTASSRRKSGEIKKPMIGMPRSTATTAPATCVPRRSNCRRLSRRGSRRAITDESVADARGPQDDEEQRDGDGAADEPEGQWGRAVGLAVPAAQVADGDQDEEQGETDHDHRDQGQT